MTNGGFAFYEPPEESAVQLNVLPRLESWDARMARSQIELGTYLDHVEDLVSERLAAIEGAAGIMLTVGVPEERSLTSGGGDLDNYLYPVVRRLGASRFSSAWARKVRGVSLISVAPAQQSSSPPLGWSTCAVTTTASAQARAFKEQIASAVPSMLLDDGPIEMQIAYRLSDRRNWAALWKPTIDALGGVLGVANPARPFTPMDDRIVRLGFHRTIDESLGWKIAISICWRVTSQ